MSAERLPLLAAFARVARHGSFTRAAAELGISPSALSQKIRVLEAAIGVRLFYRTTRRVALTEAGQQLLGRVEPALEEISTALQALDEVRGRPTGQLRISAPRSAALHLFAPAIAGFCDAYPDIRLELIASDSMIDIISNGFDAGIRLSERLAQDMVAVPISGPQRIVVVGTPGYLKRRGTPHTPHDLHEHTCISFRYPTSGALYHWEFEKDGSALKIDVNGPLIVDDLDVALAAAREHLGLACAFEHAVRDDLRERRLASVLDDWCPAFPGFFLYYDSRRQIPLKLRVFRDFLQSRLRV